MPRSPQAWRPINWVFGLDLLGGDTTATPGPLTLSLTAFGFVPQGRCLERATARAGDDIYVSGWLGDAALGLEHLKGQLVALPAAERDYLVGRYLRPEPRLKLGCALLEDDLASAALDVSDGLIADLGHIACHSSLAADVEMTRLPLSPATGSALALDPEIRQQIVSGGDDYELLFTAEAGKRDEIASLADRLALPLTRIGSMGRRYRCDAARRSRRGDSGRQRRVEAFLSGNPGNPG